MTSSRRTPIVYLLLALLALPATVGLACGPGDDPFIGYDGHRFRLGETRESVVDRLGEPVGSVEYDRGGAAYVIETFAGEMEFGYGPDDRIVTWISTTNAHAGAFVPVAVGDRREEVVSRLEGLVTTADSALLPVRIQPSTPAGSLWMGLILVFEGGRVARISLGHLAQ